MLIRPLLVRVYAMNSHSLDALAHYAYVYVSLAPPRRTTANSCARTVNSTFSTWSPYCVCSITRTLSRTASAHLARRVHSVPVLNAPSPKRTRNGRHLHSLIGCRGRIAHLSLSLKWLYTKPHCSLGRSAHTFSPTVCSSSK